MGYMPYYFFDQNSSFGTKAELKTMVSTLKDKKVQVIEDVVLNHHASLNQQDMFTFPRDDQWTPDAGDTHTYTYLKASTPYILTPRDIVKDDDDNGTQEYADYLNATITDDANKIKLSDNGEETWTINRAAAKGEGFSGARDLDHRSLNVQKIVHAYEEMLLNDIGYSGFRYDVAPGYSPRHLRDYNMRVAPRFSVAEAWKSSYNEVKSYLDHWADTIGTVTNGDVTNIKSIRHWSAAFDFPLKYGVMAKGFKANDFSQTTDAFSNRNHNNGIMGDRSLSRYAVTFVDNHDTYYPREDGTLASDNNMVTTNIAAANAYILAMPGTPCIFLKHWEDPKLQPLLKAMILARKAVGVTNQSQIIDDGYDPTDGDGYYAKINGDTIDNVIQQVLLLCGDVNTDTSKGGISTDGFKLVSEGLNYKYYISDKAYDIYAKYQNNTQSKPDCTVTTNDNTNPKGFLTTDGGVVPNHTTTLIDMGVKHIYIESATDPVFAYICSGDWSNQYTGDFPGVRLTDKVTKTDKNGTSHTLYTVNIPASGALMMVLSDGTQDLTKPDKPGYNQTVDIGPINDNDIYLKFTLGNRTSDQYGKIASYDNTTTSFTDSEEKDVINTNFKVGTHTVYFKNTVGWYNPRIYVYSKSASDATKTVEYAGAWDNRDNMTPVTLKGQEYWAWSYTGKETGTPETLVITDAGTEKPHSVDLAFANNQEYELSLTEKNEKGRYKLQKAAPYGDSSWSSSAKAAVIEPSAADEPQLAGGVENPSDLFEDNNTAQAKQRKTDSSDDGTVSYTVYFENNGVFGIDEQIAIYGWNSTSGSDASFAGTWPGGKMVKRAEKHNTHDVWQYTWSGKKSNKPTHIIFSNI